MHLSWVINLIEVVNKPILIKVNEIGRKVRIIWYKF